MIRKAYVPPNSASGNAPADSCGTFAENAATGMRLSRHQQHPKTISHPVYLHHGRVIARCQFALLLRQVDGELLARASGGFSSDELVRHYFTLVYADTGSYEAVAEKLQVDWRTVRKKVDPALLQTYRNS